MSIFNHYPNLADFEPLTRSETKDPFAPIGQPTGFSNLQSTMSSQGTYPYGNYFLHVHPWDPHYLATEPKGPFVMHPQRQPMQLVPYQPTTSTTMTSVPWGWLAFVLLLLVILFLSARRDVGKFGKYGKFGK